MPGADRARFVGIAVLAASLRILWPSPASAEDVSDDPWNIRSNSTSATRSDDGSRIIRFLGDVVITHGDLTATGEQARYLEKPRRIILTGNVVMTQDSTTVHGPYATYDREEGIARFPTGVLIERPTGIAVADVGIWRREEDRFELRGRASAADTSGTLDAEAMTYDLANERFFAVGQARMVDDVSGVIVTGENLRWERAEARATADGDPTATFHDDDGVDVFVQSDRMTYDPARQEAVAIGNVRLHREEMEATCGTALFYRAEDRVVLTESPRMVDGATVVAGDRIEMLVPAPGRRTVRVSGAASVSNRFLENRVRPQAPDADAEPPGLLGGDTGRVIEEARKTAEEAAAGVRERQAPEEADGAPLPEVVETTPEEIVQEALAKPALPTAPPPPDSTASTAASDSTASPDSTAAADSTAAEQDTRPEWLKTPSDQLPTENLLFGENITMFFVGNDLQKVVVVGAGRSKFFPSEASGELSEWNDVTGDTLDVWFTTSDVDSVHVLGNGVGEYRFPAEDTASGSPDELRRVGKLVDYKAPRIRYLRGVETMHLDQGAEVKYKTMVLTSGKIDFDANKETMTASGDPPPVLIDKEDEITGARMNYHLPSGKGEISTGRTRFELGYYSGRDVWKMGEDVLAVDHAQFTTCDLEDPHYHFDCRQMKIYLDDKMVAKPVVLKIGHIPVLALPFYMTSLRKDRHSGFLFPSLELGVDNARGRFIRNLGYYWAMNDYTDLTATVDYYPARDQLVGYLTGRYNVRYRFQGNVRLKYNRDEGAGRRENAVEVVHTQDFNSTTRLTADAHFLSSNEIYREIDDANRLNRDLSSHATFTKRLEGSRNLLIDVRRDENLDTGFLTETLPSIQFTQPSVPITGKQVRGGGAGEEEEESSWLDGVYWKLDGRAVNQRRVLTDGSEERHIGSTADGRLTTTQDLLRYLRISPAMGYEATWIDEDRTGKNNALRATYNGSLTARTDVYGTFLKGVGPVKGFRHVIRPSLSWNWAPEFREYFYADSLGNLQDRFFSFGGIRGTQRKTNSMSFSLGNLVQTKFLRNERENRYDLFNLSSSISYNFLAADNGQKPLSNLNNSLTILSASPINQSWGVTHDPYTWRLLNTRITTRATLSSRMFGGAGSGEEGQYGLAGGLPGSAYEWEDPVGGGRDTERRVGERYTPGEWQAQISHTQSSTPSTGATSSHVVFGGTWSPTARWKLRFDYDYDLENGENTSQQLSVQRTIHCWELSFDRRLLGGTWQYYLRINVTDLTALKVERGDGISGPGFGTSSLPGF